MNSLLDASSRVAFAAILHDLGKFAERAAAPEHPIERLDALFLETVERSVPDLIQGEMSPFTNRGSDSLIDTAAMHRAPETLLQWIIATADQVASGFGREDGKESNSSRNDQARLRALFEQIRLEENTPDDSEWRYSLKPITPENLFPVRRKDCERQTDKPAQKEYRELWDAFLAALKEIPASHRSQWPLWLDHLDTLWQIYTHAIPSSTTDKNKSDVSLYDHSKVAAALAVALWRWHIAQEGLTEEDRECADWEMKKFLLVQGDFFGIQDFIFSEGSETNKHAAKLLRGRSFQVSLFTELAALKVLETLELPSTSQIINAAGKFLIVAPNTPDAQQKLAKLRRELNEWFLEESFGLTGIGLTEKAASCNDFLAGRFEDLMKALFADLGRAKLSRFDLTVDTPKVFQIDYPLGVCQYNNRLPADGKAEGDKAKGDNKASAKLSRDQKKIGTALTRKNRLLIVREGTDLCADSFMDLEGSVFGYRIGFIQSEEMSGKFDKLAQNGQLRRCWDLSLPKHLKDTLWHGCARRYINAYVPQFSPSDPQTGNQYRGVKIEDSDPDPRALKTFDHLACEDRKISENDKEKWIGQIALATLKGDVDNLGNIFRQGLKQNTFAKMAALSRQMNAFFAVWLPAFCQETENYRNTYTVFAGGDDFFLIGPWHSTQKLAADMAEHFKAYVAENSEIHFSAGFTMTQPGHPVYMLAEQAENALERAKRHETDGAKKNAVCLYGEVVSWKKWPELTELEQEVHKLASKDQYRLSSGYVYDLLRLLDLATSKTVESAMWRSYFTYRTHRYVTDNKLPRDAQAHMARIFSEQGISPETGQGSRFRIPLFNFFYSKRS